MATHDPGKVLEMLRDHLTHPEASVAFLLGAGTSCAVQIPIPPVGGPTTQDDPPATCSLIPNVAKLTSLCEEKIRQLDTEGVNNRFGSAFDAIELEIRPASRPTNIEDILSCVRRKLQAVGIGDTLSGLSKDDLVRLERTIRETIAVQVNPEPATIPETLPHDDLVRWIGRMPRSRPVEIFTTNYDVLLETALEAERIPAFDGFVGCNRPFFSHDSLTRVESSPGATWTRLWKIHGSITWKLDNIRGRSRVVRTVPHNEGEMILPSHHKYDESRKQPYSALLERLVRVLDREDAILFVCGYSFSDEHINAIIFDALEAKRRPHVVALQYEEPDSGSTLADRAGRFLNLMVLGPRSGFLGGRRANWKLDDASSASHLSQAFLLDDGQDGAPPSGTGRLLLGDFVHFAQFLGSLTRPA